MGKKCEHGRRRRYCKECGGSGICEHGWQHYSCKDCGGAGICEHGRQRYGCKDCGGGGPVPFLEATEVEAFDGEEDPQCEWVPTVEVYLVAEPRRGEKRWHGSQVDRT